jgi:hypothetical protein
MVILRSSSALRALYTFHKKSGRVLPLPLLKATNKLD